MTASSSSSLLVVACQFDNQINVKDEEERGERFEGRERERE